MKSVILFLLRHQSLQERKATIGAAVKELSDLHARDLIEKVIPGCHLHKNPRKREKEVAA
jgi:hypothetical protein